MDTRIVFEDKTATAHQWGKYEIGRGRHYIWNRSNIATRNKYMWEKYGVRYITKPTFVWDYFDLAVAELYHSWEKRQVDPAYEHTWNLHDIIPAGSIAYKWSKSYPRYIWERYERKEVPQYIYQYTINSVYSTLRAQHYKLDSTSGNGKNPHDSSLYTGYFCDIQDFFGSTGATKLPEARSAYNGVSLSNYVKIGTAKYDQTATISGSYNVFTCGYQYSRNATFDTSTGVMALRNPSTSTTTTPTPLIPLVDDIANAAVGTRIFATCITNWSYSTEGSACYMVPCPRYTSATGSYVTKTPLTEVKLSPGAYYNVFWDTSVYSGGIYCLEVIFVKTATGELDMYAAGINNYGASYTRTPTGETTLEKGKFIDNVYATNQNAHPDDDFDTSYYYNYVGSDVGEYIEEEESDTKNTYPQNGISGNYYYIYLGSEVATTARKGALRQTLQSTNRHEYPDAGPKDGYWYQYKGNEFAGQYYTTANYLPSYGSTSTIYYSNIKPTINRQTGTYSFNAASVRSSSASAMDSAQIASLVTSGYKYVMFGGYSGQRYYYEFISTTTKVGTVFNELLRYGLAFDKGPIEEYGNYEGMKRQNDSFFQDTTNKVKGDTSGSYRGQVDSENENAYPTNGKQGDYWYIFNRQVGEAAMDKGTYEGTVTAYQLDAYPQDGTMNGSWYLYKDYEIELYEGEKVGEVSDPDREAFPDNGVQDGYWYKYRTYSDDHYAGKFVDFVTAPNKNGWPQNGEQGGYWYIYISTVGADIYTLTSTEITKHVTYKQNTNSQEDYVIGDAVSASAEFEILDEKKEAKKYLGLKFRYYTRQASDSQWRLIGKFNVKEIERPEEFRAKIVGYDEISKFDIYVDEWIERTKWPMALKDVFASLCNYCGVGFVSTDFLNNNFMVKDNFTGVNVTGRQILGYIAQAAGGFACADANGLVAIKRYQETGVTLDKTRYVKATIADYKTPQINKLTVQMKENDLGVSSGDGTCCYKITNNPLFYADSNSEIQSAVNTLYTAIRNVTYTPATISLLQDFGINCGDIITIGNEKIYVMNKTITSSGVELSCTGSETREATGEEVNSEIVALRGKTNELIRDLEKTQSILTDTAAQLRSEITQTAGEIKAEVQYQGEVISQIKANVDGIKLTYNSANGTASITIADITVSNLVDGNYVQKVVAGIDLTGYVRFNDLQRTGSTIINGSNITTGYISADRIQLTGAIAWSDLSTNCKNKIVEFAEDAASGMQSSIPSYIHSTYIDSTNIYSPNIYGARITAGTTTDGYIEMAANGMSFKSKTGGSLIGMGYYPGNYNYPYILLGAGVDAYGTDRGMIKKYSNGIWIGDSDGVSGSTVGRGTGLFVNFGQNRLYKYENGVATQL